MPSKIIQFILNKFYPSHKEKYKQPLRVIKAIEPQMRCRTKDQGTSYYRCPEDGTEMEVYHSCRNKGCTVCGANKQKQWLEKQKERLLNCEHYHLVFTLPHEYQTLWLYNRKWFINTQFKITSETLNNLLMGNTHKGKHYEGKLKAMPGYMSTLHTWGRSLNLHPHIHVLMTAGGLTHDGKWKKVENDYLLPIKQVKELYRGKFQAKIKEFIQSEEINIPKGETKASLLKTHKELYEKEWSVRIQEKYEQGNGVLIYLSRYLGSSPVKPEQITLINDDKEVLFRYWSHRDKQQKEDRLSIETFLKKYLLHQSEPRVHTIRYYGLYGSQAKAKREKSIGLLGETTYQKESLSERIAETSNELLCRCCGAIMRLSHVSTNRWKLKNPVYRGEIKRAFSLNGIRAPIPSG
ncbi:MAG: transposase [Sulfurovaceae bacterium]|nr:transposase [Sulfurovaceae bacterium]